MYIIMVGKKLGLELKATKTMLKKAASLLLQLLYL